MTETQLMAMGAQALAKKRMVGLVSVQERGHAKQSAEMESEPDQRYVTTMTKLTSKDAFRTVQQPYQAGHVLEQPLMFAMRRAET